MICDKGSKSAQDKIKYKAGGVTPDFITFFWGITHKSPVIVDIIWGYLLKISFLALYVSSVAKEIVSGL